MKQLKRALFLMIQLRMEHEEFEASINRKKPRAIVKDRN
jgi:hypothetical protein